MTVETVAGYVGLSPDFILKLTKTIVLAVLLTVLRSLMCWLSKRRIGDPTRAYYWRRNITYAYGFVLLMILGIIWIERFSTFATFLGLISAGLAIAMHDTVANVAGWVFILTRNPFKVGDRIEIGGITGDVIDIRVFEFSVIEVGNWVDADQNTGRIVHVPNGKVLREPLANYETGFEYIWHEIPVLITFESDWRKAKEILKKVVQEKAEHLSVGAEEQIRRAAMTYLIFLRKLSPIVYTSVRDSGVLLTMRYIVKPRQRRGSEGEIWEAVLTEFAVHDDINLAYPTTRFFRTGEQHGPAGN